MAEDVAKAMGAGQRARKLSSEGTLLVQLQRPLPKVLITGPYNGANWQSVLEMRGRVVGDFGLSATEIGRRIGANAMEVNRLLKDQGILYGEPGAYGLTSKGEEFGVQRYHDNGYGGVAHRSYETTHFDPSIMDILDSSPEKLAKVRADILANRQEQRAATKRAQAKADADFRAHDVNKAEEATVDEIDPLRVLLVGGGILAAVVAIRGVNKGVGWCKRKRAEKVKVAEGDSDASAGGEVM